MMDETDGYTEDWFDDDLAEYNRNEADDYRPDYVDDDRDEDE